MNKTISIKATVGERQMAFVNALKAVDVEKEDRTRAMVKAVMEWLAEDCNNNGTDVSLNAEQNGKRQV